MEQKEFLKPWLDAITSEDLFQAGKLARQTIYSEPSLWNEYADYIEKAFDGQEKRRVAIKILQNPILLDGLKQGLGLVLFESIKIEDAQRNPNAFFHWIDALKPKQLQTIKPNQPWDKQPFSTTLPIENTLRLLGTKLHKMSRELLLDNNTEFLKPATIKLLGWIQETPQLIQYMGLSELYKITPSHTLLAPLEPLYQNKKDLYDAFLDTTLKNERLNVKDASVFIQSLTSSYLNDNTIIKNFLPALMAAENHQFELADAWLAAGAPFDAPHKVTGSQAIQRTTRKKMTEILPYFEKYQAHILPTKLLEKEHWPQIWNARHKLAGQANASQPPIAAAIGQYALFLEKQGLGTPPVEWMMLAAGSNNAQTLLDLLHTKLKITDKDSEGNTLWHVIMNGSFSPHYQKSYKNIYTHPGEKPTNLQKNEAAASLVMDALIKSGSHLLEVPNNAGQLPITCAANNRFKITKTLFPILNEHMKSILLAINTPSLMGKNIKMENISQVEHLKKLLKPETFSRLEGEWLHKKNASIIQQHPKKISAL